MMSYIGAVATRDWESRNSANQCKLLESAFIPKPCDSERIRSIMPCFQCDDIPEGWPTCVQANQLDRKFYAQLENESLFFMFYYQEGSLAQVQAAKALKSKDWRFHKGPGMFLWLQRMDQPKVITAQYERGNYRYFDWRSWTEKEKFDFTFEYKWLEQVVLSGEFGR